MGELELIRERAKEKREKRQAAWEEKKQAREEHKEKDEHCEGGTEKKEEVKSKNVEDDSSSEEEGWCEGVPMFRGIGNLLEELKEEKVTSADEVFTDEDDEENVNGKCSKTKDKEIVNAMMVDIVNDIFSRTAHMAVINQENRKPKNEENILECDSSDEGPEELGIVRADGNEHIDINTDDTKSATIESSKKSRKRKKKSNTKLQSDSKDVTGGEAIISDCVTKPPAKIQKPTVFEQRIRPPTLLEKLLLNEIKKERNKILQCVRFVVKSNFFDSDQFT